MASGKARSSASHHCAGAKSCSVKPKGHSGSLKNQRVLICSGNSTVVSYKQSFYRNVCPDLDDLGFYKSQEDPDQVKTCTW